MSIRVYFYWCKECILGRADGSGTQMRAFLTSSPNLCLQNGKRSVLQWKIKTESGWTAYYEVPRNSMNILLLRQLNFWTLRHSLIYNNNRGEHMIAWCHLTARSCTLQWGIFTQVREQNSVWGITVCMGLTGSCLPELLDCVPGLIPSPFPTHRLYRCSSGSSPVFIHVKMERSGKENCVLQ